MTDRYGYIGIETLLNYCQNSKDHSITPNDFMRMNRVRIEEPKQGEWIDTGYGTSRCSVCGEKCQTYCMDKPRDRYCLWCGARMKEGDEK